MTALDATPATAAAPARGLTEQEAERRLTTHGPNELPAARSAGLFRQLAEQLTDPLIVVLLAAAVLTVATGDTRDAVVIALVVVLNTTVGVLQQRKAERTLAALEELAAPTARAVRDNREREIPGREVVPGDLLRIVAGDVVPADGDLVTGHAVEVDESSLTGESVPVAKDPPAASLAAGTVVTRGRGYVVVTATGRDSALGLIATSLRQTRAVRTPLQRRLSELGRWLALGVAVASLLVLVMGLLRGQPVELMVVTAISLAVAAVPESLPAVVTLALALGARRMAEEHALVRRLPSVETLGSVTVLATDKTGTLTEGRMAVTDLCTPGASTSLDVVAADAVPEPARRLLTLALLCSDVDDGAVVVDPMELALRDAAERVGLLAAAGAFERVAEAPFDVTRRLMTVAVRTPDGDVLVVSKGAPEALLAGVGDTTVHRALTRTADELAREGRRVVAVGVSRLAALPADLTEHVADLEPVGLIGMLDPLRAEAADAIARCRSAGIAPYLITGDHPATADAIARQVGILGDGRSRTAGKVFARARPDDKLKLITSLQAAGEVVAMTGDGVNDAPALRRADVGVVMGRRGTEVAKQAADVVLLDDDLGTLVTAVAEGRRVYSNIRRFLLYAMSGGVAELLVMVLGPFVGMTLPLLPAQILWVNLMTHGLPGVAMGAEPGETGALSARPRPPQQSVLGGGLWRQVLLLGTVLGTATLILGAWTHELGGTWRTSIFVTLGLLQLAVALGLRVRRRAVGVLVPTVVATAALHVGVTYLPFAQHYLEVGPLSAARLSVAVGVSAIGYLAAAMIRRPRRSSAGPAS